jgi:hypothetical protein
LSGTDLRGADLRKAHLKRATLREAHLARTHFDGADLTGVSFMDAEHNVAAQLEQLRVTVHHDARIAPLQHVTHAPMPPVKRLAILPIEPAHTRHEIPLRGLNQQMIMIAHQAIGGTGPVLLLDLAVEQA